ncbi:hypothetical protein CYMTET_6173 [Cymbomonas tetramitiformis]|uniref:Uncharacterized protein n=1 Tax=Cymbomonas tetramitiformis TaxID=36881 RepID=A0AAE0GXZ6_9CHLO|nr:hypothetical protein CYMTET_6173 [Cymbomonas tetramitiformis]
MSSLEEKYNNTAWRRSFVVPPVADDKSRNRSRSPARPERKDQQDDDSDDDDGELTVKQLHDFFEGENLLPEKARGTMAFKCPLCVNRMHFQGLSALHAHLTRPGKKEPAKHKWVLDFLNDRSFFH